MSWNEGYVKAMSQNESFVKDMNWNESLVRDISWNESLLGRDRPSTGQLRDGESLVRSLWRQSSLPD